MQVAYSVVANPHPNTTHGCLARTEKNVFYWLAGQHHPSDYAVLAKNPTGKLVGIQKFFFRIEDDKRILDAISTYVWPLYQKEGIGQMLWTTALTTLRVTDVKVNAISDKGKTLVESLQERFPEIRFVLEEGGDRRLRSLKGKGRRKAA